MKKLVRYNGIPDVYRTIQPSSFWRSHACSPNLVVGHLEEAGGHCRRAVGKRRLRIRISD